MVLRVHSLCIPIPCINPKNLWTRESRNAGLCETIVKNWLLQYMSLSNGAQYHVTKWWAPHRCRCNGCGSPSGYICAFCEMWLLSRSNLRTVGWGSVRSPVMLRELVHFSLSHSCSYGIFIARGHLQLQVPQVFTSCLMKAMLQCGNTWVLDGGDQSDIVQIATHQYHLDYGRCWVLRLCGSMQSSDHCSWAVPCVCHIRFHYIQIPHKMYWSVETMLRDVFISVLIESPGGGLHMPVVLTYRCTVCRAGCCVWASTIAPKWLFWTCIAWLSSVPVKYLNSMSWPLHIRTLAVPQHSRQIFLTPPRRSLKAKRWKVMCKDKLLSYSMGNSLGDLTGCIGRRDGGYRGKKRHCSQQHVAGTGRRGDHRPSTMIALVAV